MQAGLGPRLPSSLGGLLALSPSLLGCLRTISTAATSDADLQEHQEHDKRYVDRLKLTAKAGRGGNGCASFYQGASRGQINGKIVTYNRLACECWVSSKM